MIITATAVGDPMDITTTEAQRKYLVKTQGAVVGEFQKPVEAGEFVFYYATPAILLRAKDLLEIYYKLEELNDNERPGN